MPNVQPSVRAISVVIASGCHQCACVESARKAAADAKLIVVNHTLFFALLNTDELDGEAGDDGKKVPGFLFPNDFAVLV